jgi:hypothetical protein
MEITVSSSTSFNRELNKTFAGKYKISAAASRQFDSCRPLTDCRGG